MAANAPSVWRIDRARAFATSYIEQRPSLVLATGSAARGLADEYSDLDVMVYWRVIPAKWLATPPLQPFGGGRFAFVPTSDGGYIEQYFVAGLKVDVGHVTADAWERRISSVIEGMDVSPEHQKALGGFLDGVVIYDDGSHDAWHDRVASYPDALAEAVVSANLMMYPTWAPRHSMLDRGEVLGFRDMMVTTAKQLMCVLAGLNRVYFSTIEPKWIAHTLNKMARKPDHTLDRLNAMQSSDGYAAIDAMASLIADVLALVELEMPSVDTRIARAVQAIPLTAAGPSS